MQKLKRIVELALVVPFAISAAEVSLFIPSHGSFDFFESMPTGLYLQLDTSTGEFSALEYSGYQPTQCKGKFNLAQTSLALSYEVCDDVVFAQEKISVEHKVEFQNTSASDFVELATESLSDPAAIYLHIITQMEGKGPRTHGRDGVIVAKQGNMESIIQALVDRKQGLEDQVQIEIIQEEQELQKERVQ